MARRLADKAALAGLCAELGCRTRRCGCPARWLDGRLDLAGWRRSWCGIEERAWFAWDDPRPFAAMGTRTARQRVGRLLSPRV